MLVDVNELLLAEQKKSNILAFSIQPKNKHHLSTRSNLNEDLKDGFWIHSTQGYMLDKTRQR